MGIYMASEKEIVVAIAKALNGIEGDFSSTILCKALDRCKKYPHVCNVTPINEMFEWEKYIEV